MTIKIKLKYSTSRCQIVKGKTKNMFWNHVIVQTNYYSPDKVSILPLRDFFNLFLLRLFSLFINYYGLTKLNDYVKKKKNLIKLHIWSARNILFVLVPKVHLKFVGNTEHYSMSARRLRCLLQVCMKSFDRLSNVFYGTS